MKLVVRISVLFIMNSVRCTIDGISYLDEFKFKDLFNNPDKKDNPCNPLFWYPRQIPDYCHRLKISNPPNVKLEPTPKPPKPSILPIPVPSAIVAPVLPAAVIPSPMVPPPIIPSPMIPSAMINSPMFPSSMVHSPMVPSPMVPSSMVPSSLVSSPMVPSPLVPSPMVPSPMVPSPMVPSSMISSPMVPSPMIPSPAVNYNAPLVAPNPMVPAIQQNPYAGYQIPRYPYTYGQQNAGMVPGLPGIVTKDGGINILPFSDAYSELLEKHKQKIIRRKLEKVLKRYEDYPRSKHYWRRKRFKKMAYDYE